MAGLDATEQVAFVRRRLCLDRSRDAEVAEALAGMAGRSETVAVVIQWEP